MCCELILLCDASGFWFGKNTHKSFLVYVSSLPSVLARRHNLATRGPEEASDVGTCAIKIDPKLFSAVAFEMPRDHFN